MAKLVGPPPDVIRNRPISTALRELLEGAADATGIEMLVVVSGGQTSNHTTETKGIVGGWIGSRRHDDGRAADLELVKDGTTLTFTDEIGTRVADFVTEAAARGATGIGAGVNYMGPKRLHVGFGKSVDDSQKLVWGAAGASANAPAWLRSAADKGWRRRGAGHAATPLGITDVGRSVVMARSGLWLRKGPGLSFDRAKLLDVGTVLTVLGIDGEWARVDLQGDRRIDGYVFATFLEAAESSNLLDSEDGTEEPAYEQNLGNPADAPE